MSDPSTPEAIEADIAVQRQELAHTIDQLSAKFDVKSRAKAKATELQDRVLDSVTGQELSVRQTEELVRRLREPKPQPAGPAARNADPDLERVEEDLRRALGTKVSLARTRRGGRIVIEYYSEEELGRLYDRLTGGTA